jgi:c-di-AMP phosphodiesterase-like protein
MISTTFIFVPVSGVDGTGIYFILTNILFITVPVVGRHKLSMISVFWTTLALSVHHLDTFVKQKFMTQNVQSQNLRNQTSIPTTHHTYLMIIHVLLLNMAHGSIGWNKQPARLAFDGNVFWS